MDLRQLLPAPDFESCRSVLCIQPHPDDNEISAGGTIARLSARGAFITYVTVTDGGLGTNDPCMPPEVLAPLRRREAEAAGRLLGAMQFRFLDYPDGGNIHASSLRTCLVEIIREYRPQAVMAPDPWLSYEGHSDHRLTGLAAVEACLFSGFPNYEVGRLNPDCAFQPEMVALYNSNRPNTWVNVDATWEKKMKALALHASQFAAGDPLGYFLESKARQDAVGRECKLAETFKVIPPILLHAVPNVDLY